MASIMDEPGQRMVRIVACLRGLFTERQNSEFFGYGFPVASTARIWSFELSFRRALSAAVMKLEQLLLLLMLLPTAPAAASVPCSRPRE